MTRKHVFAGITTGLVCLAPAAVQAQAAAAPPAAAASGAGAGAEPAVQQVIVTAQKRKEDIRDVPLAVSVVGAEQLKDFHIDNVQDLTRNIPNMSFTTQAGPGLSTMEIRGVSSQAGNAVVSVYLDDVSLTTRNLYSQGTADPNFFDIDHIEVLRGPQGTLYGASAVGGTVKFISNQPDLKHFTGSASAEVSYTDHGGWNNKVEGVLNVPFAPDTAALRLGVQIGHDSGYIDQVDPATLQVIRHGINSSSWLTFKGALRADVGQGWTLTPAVFTQETDTQDIDAAYLAVGDYQLPPAQTGAPLQRFQTSKIVREPGHDRLVVPSFTVQGPTSIGDFTGVLSGYQRRFNRVQDGTEINSPYIGSVTTDPALGAIVAGLPSAVDLLNKVDQTSLELRLTSKDYEPGAGRPLTWIVGLYEVNTKTQVFDNEPIFGINAAFAAAGQDIGNPADLQDAFPGDFVGDSSYYSARHYHDKQAAGFGELTWHFSPEFSATAGLRYSQGSQHFAREGNYYYAGGPTSAAFDLSAQAYTPRLTADWKISPQTSLYANIAKGFRFGGANRPIPDTPIVESDLQLLQLPKFPPQSFAPDSLWNYEVGSKSDLWDHRLSMNLAAFYIDWKNIQQDITLPNAGFDFETNTGNARSYGLEAEIRARLTASFTLLVSGGITHAVFSEDVPAFGAVADIRKGDRIQGVPSGNASVGGDYHFALSDAASAFVRGNVQWTGSSRGSLFHGDNDYTRPGYVTVDASSGADWERWEFSVFAKNLANNHTILQHPSIQNVSEAYYLRPRTVGVTASYAF